MTPIKQLKESEPFNRLPDTLFLELLTAAQLQRFPANTFVFRQNDAPTGFLYVVMEGLVEITVLSPGGVEMVVDYRNEGDFFGGTPIFTGDPYTGGARTVRPTECYLIPEALLRHAQQSAPEIGAYFSRIVSSRVRRLYGEIVADNAQTLLSQGEAYPFKKRLSEIMTTPVATVAASDPVTQVARRMVECDCDAVVVIDAQRRPLGIVTERDLVSRVILPNRAEGLQLSAGEVMNRQLHTMPPATYMYEAMAYMLGQRIKQIPVVDGDEVVGIVTLSDLMRYRSLKAMLLLGSIHEETTLDGLAAIRRELHPLARMLLSETRSTPEVMEILSYIHHGIIRRVYELCLAEATAHGAVPPPARHCFLIMGSGGRREMLLGPDQDHGLIYEDVDATRLVEVEAFFAPFAERLVAALTAVGYPLCQGQVMANNPAWRGRLGDWKRRIQDWVNDPEPQKVRYSSIFFDFAPLAGDATLAAELREMVQNEIEEFQGFLYHMMSLDLAYKVPLGLLNRFVVEKSGHEQGKLSLKQGGSVYIVDCLRMFALERRIAGITTLERLKSLVEQHVFAAETAEHIRAAFEALTFLRLRNEIDQLTAGEAPSHYLDPRLLSKNEQDLLREAFSAVSKLQDATKRHFGRTAF